MTGGGRAEWRSRTRSAEDTAQVRAIVVGVHTKVGTLLRNPEARVMSGVLVQICAETSEDSRLLSIREREE